MIGGFQVGAFQTAYQQDAGRGQAAGRPRKRRRYEVEIDGQVFPVESLDHARALLDKARELAVSKAAEVAERVVASRLKDKAPEGKPIRVPVPQIRTPDTELANIVISARHAIAKIYRQQALEAEIRLRLQLVQKRQDESDEDDLLLLM